MNTRYRRLVVALVLGGAGAWLGLSWLERSYREEPYSLIEDRLNAGAWVAEPPPGTSAVVNLCGREDPYPVEARHWRPILEGGKEPDLAWLRETVEFIDAQRRAGRSTYVHCRAGMNRSGAVVTAYLMFEHAWSREEALAFARSRRPQFQPNPALMRLLAEWEQELKDRARPPD